MSILTTPATARRRRPCFLASPDRSVRPQPPGFSLSENGAASARGALRPRFEGPLCRGDPGMVNRTPYSREGSARPNLLHEPWHGPCRHNLAGDLRAQCLFAAPPNDYIPFGGVVRFSRPVLKWRKWPWF